MTSDEGAAARPLPSNSKKRKTLYLVRHAESEENRRLASLQHVLRCVWGLTWPHSKDVKAAWELVDVSGQVDSPVSSRGRDQISAMHRQLESHNFLESRGVELVLHSPLLRAKDTCIGLFPPDDESITDADGSTTKITTTRCTRSNDVTCPIEETDLLLEKTPMEWVFGSTFRSRIDQFAQFVQSRPESTVVAVGHSQFFRAMLGVTFKFDNCDVWRVELLCDSPSSLVDKASSSSSTSTTPSPLSSSCGDVDGSSPCAQPPQFVDGGGGDENGEIVTLLPWSHLRRVFACPKPVEPSETDGDDHDDDNKNCGGGKESEKYSSSSKDKNA